MGVDPISIAVIAMTAFKAVSAVSNAKSQAKSITRNAENQARTNQQNAQYQADANLTAGNLATKERAKEIRAKAARQTTSFLSSGLTLDGTPNSVIGETYSTGLEDLDAIKKNYDTTNSNIFNITNTNNNNLISQANSQSKQAIAAGRSEAIGAIASGFSGFAGGGSMFGAASSGASSFMGGTGFGTGVDVYKSVNNPANSGIF